MIKQKIKSSSNDEYFCTATLRSDLKKRALRGTGATVFSQIISFFVQFFGTMILARLLTPADFGLITMVTAFSLLLQNFGVNGFTEAIIQREYVNHKMMSTLFWINATISISLTLLFIGIAPILAWFYKEPRLNLITIGVSLSIIAGGMSTFHMALIRRSMQFYKSSGIEVAARVISVATAIVLAIKGLGYWSLVVSVVAWPLTVAIGGWIFCRWRPGLPTSGTKVRPILKFAFHTYGNFTFNYLSRNIDKLLIGWRYEAQPLGFYKKAYDLFSLPANQLTAPLSNVALAVLSRLQNEPEKYRRYYLDAISALAFVGMPLSAILTIAGNDIILFVLGPQWEKAGEIFCYFGASIGIMLIYNTQGWLHLSLGRPDRWFRWGVFECIITSFFFIVGLPWGIAGIAIAYSLSFYILVVPCLRYAGKPIGLRLSSLAAATGKYFLAALAAGWISFYVLYSLNITAIVYLKLNHFSRIMVSTTLCLFTYLLLTIALYRGTKPITQFLSLLQGVLPVNVREQVSVRK